MVISAPDPCSDINLTNVESLSLIVADRQEKARWSSRHTECAASVHIDGYLSIREMPEKSKSTQVFEVKHTQSPRMNNAAHVRVSAGDAVFVVKGDYGYQQDKYTLLVPRKNYKYTVRIKYLSNSLMISVKKIRIANDMRKISPSMQRTNLLSNRKMKAAPRTFFKPIKPIKFGKVPASQPASSSLSILDRWAQSTASRYAAPKSWQRRSLSRQQRKPAA